METPPKKCMKNKASVILFYKYGQLSNNRKTMEVYCQAMKDLCHQLNLKGRILIGLSNKSEGINGTLAGNYPNVYAYTLAMHGKKYNNEKMDNKFRNIIQDFWKASDELSKSANIPNFIIDSPNDFKWSFPSSYDLFPDLNIKLVNEIINTGGKLSSISMDDTNKGYLTPEEWHERIQNNDSKKVIIDVRNQKEFAIGHFNGALDPKTKTFEQFPQWVDQHKIEWQDKEIYMYCTGGIRCEKASAYVRNVLPTSKKSVYHLKGGIHKYLEKYGANGLFHGKNFVFDRRGADDPSQCQSDSTIVGKCLYCQTPWDVFTSDTICTVCREPVLICHACKEKVQEYHCIDHYYLKSCYFTHLSHFTMDQLQNQYQQLQQYQQTISIGKKFKQRRKTLQKQMNKILHFLNEPTTTDTNNSPQLACRSCGDLTCNGSCWGFHGLARIEKVKIENQMNDNPSSIHTNTHTHTHTHKHTNVNTNHHPRERKSSSKRNSKIEQKQNDIEEIQRLQLSCPPTIHRNPLTSIRCPPPCTRILQTRVKGKWCGKQMMDVLKDEFDALSKPNALEDHLNHSLIHINHKPIHSNYILKNMDTIGRIVHWHEPPILVPSKIHVQKIKLPECISFKDDYDFVYCCDKPSTVPTHPVGPYLSNSLTLMVEAQESLETRSLIPCHRLDRVTSGLTLCCVSPNVARLLQTCMSMGNVKKLYLAKVKVRTYGALHIFLSYWYDTMK